MEKSYRDLFEGLTALAARTPPLFDLMGGIGRIDDVDPMRVPALKAMKQATPPPLDLLYEFRSGEDAAVALYAENPLRKRKAAAPSLCAQLALPRWCLDPETTLPGCHEMERARYLDLIQRSFSYLEVRIAIYFDVRPRNALIVRPSSAPVLRIEAAMPGNAPPRPLTPERTLASPQSLPSAPLEQTSPIEP